MFSVSPHPSYSYTGEWLHGKKGTKGKFKKTVEEQLSFQG